MPILSLQPQTASIHFGVNADGGRPRSLSLEALLEHDQDLLAKDERSLRILKWSIQLLDSTSYNETATSEHAIGFLSHIPEYKSEYDLMAESIHASVAIEPSLFKSIYEVLISGRLPNSLVISCEELKYGWDPDGKVKIWDIENNRSIPIEEISINIPLIAASSRIDNDSEFDTELHQTFPATSADIRIIGDRLTTALSSNHSQITRQFKYLIAIVFISFLILLFK